MSNWLYLRNNGCTNFSVSHIQFMKDIGHISSPKNGMSLWMVLFNSLVLCLCNLEEPTYKEQLIGKTKFEKQFSQKC